MTPGTAFITLFSSKLMNVPNKLECYITLGCKDFAMTNTQAYWENL